MLTGRVPFPGEGFGEILVAHLTKPPEPPSTLNPTCTPSSRRSSCTRSRRIATAASRRWTSSRPPIDNPDAHYSVVAGAAGAVGVDLHSGGTMMLPEGGARTPTGQGAAAATGQRKGPTTQTGPTPTTLSGAASET